MISPLIDAIELIESAFHELECVAESSEIEHGGDRFGYVVWHTCLQGFLCETHYRKVAGDVIDRAEMEVELFGATKCAYCGMLFRSRKSMFTVYPL